MQDTGAHQDTVAYKVLTAEDCAALRAGAFKGSPVDLADGFIHLSTAAQLTETVNRHFAEQGNLTIAAIDLVALGDKVRWEPSRGGQLFPHLYAALLPQHVTAQGQMERQADGAVRLPGRAASTQVFFDGGCPVCSREIAFYKKRPGAEAFEWVNVVDSPPQALGPGLSRELALARMHVRLADGTLLSGASAFAALWRQMPGFRALGWLLAVPPFGLFAEIGYRGFVQFRRLWRTK